MIGIIFNGQEEIIEENLTIEQFLLSKQNYLPKMFVVEKNRNIIYKEHYSSEKISEHDEIEVVGFCGGG